MIKKPCDCRQELCGLKMVWERIGQILVEQSENIIKQRFAVSVVRKNLEIRESGNGPRRVEPLINADGR